MEITVKNRFAKDTPRKLRLVADAVKRMKVTVARDHLQFTNRAAAQTLLKGLNSALAVVKEKDLDVDKFVLGEIRCDQGPRMKRRLMKSRGQSTLIQKRMAHLTVTITDKIFKEPKRRFISQINADQRKSAKQDQRSKTIKE